jgi:hypothetical protein
MADDRGAVWTARIRDAKQVLNELRCVSLNSVLAFRSARPRCLTSNTLDFPPRPRASAPRPALPG